ncbi:MAG: hypothetical protein DDT24_00915 [Chloroflexi bacterium]|nr:hypothetical protein [Chloroflexota bacterium]
MMGLPGQSTGWTSLLEGFGSSKQLGQFVAISGVVSQVSITGGGQLVSFVKDHKVIGRCLRVCQALKCFIPGQCIQAHNNQVASVIGEGII